MKVYEFLEQWNGRVIIATDAETGFVYIDTTTSESGDYGPDITMYDVKSVRIITQNITENGRFKSAFVAVITVK